jgi:hypothetical protein
MTNGTNEPGSGAPPKPDNPEIRRWKRIALVTGGLVAVLVVVVVALLVSHNGDVSGADAAATSTSRSTSTTTTTTPTTTLAPTTTPTTLATPPPTTSSAPVITSYTASTTSILCPATDVSTTVPLSTVTLAWATQNASGVDLSVDGPGLYGSYGAAGSQTVNVACNGKTHTFRITAKGTQGQTATKTVSVATHK